LGVERAKLPWPYADRFRDRAIFNKVLHAMIRAAGRLLYDVVGLALPDRCGGCDRSLLRFERGLCTRCIADLPRTRFHDDPLNKVERLFHGKVELQAASAFLQFSRSGVVQHILHRLKYKGDRNAGMELGRLMATDVKDSPRFSDVDTVMAVPLHAQRSRMRGYNQSQVLVDGMRERWSLRSLKDGLIRVVRTTSQTRRGRLERWQNVKEAFEPARTSALRDAHVLLVDDVVTTGATIESCVRALRTMPGVRVSVYTAACA
jgi:ComF family protein